MLLAIGSVKTASRVQELEREVKVMNNTINSLVASINKLTARRDLTILNGEGSSAGAQLGPDHCASVCSGTTGRTRTDWVSYSKHVIYTEVNITRCGFTNIPAITTSLEAHRYSQEHDQVYNVLGTTSVYGATKSSFRVFLLDAKYGFAIVDIAASKWSKWNIDWIAVGFTC